jgi:hypothetical protein
MKEPYLLGNRIQRNFNMLRALPMHERCLAFIRTK